MEPAPKKISANVPRATAMVVRLTMTVIVIAAARANSISVFKRNPETGILAEEGKSFPVEAPMRILFT